MVNWYGVQTELSIRVLRPTGRTFQLMDVCSWASANEELVPSRSHVSTWYIVTRRPLARGGYRDSPRRA